MVHDLTANSDFHGERNLGWLLNIRYLSVEQDNDLTSPDKEIILTGTAQDRGYKRYCLDYKSNRKNICDRCGASIRTRPWDFQNNNTLCNACEKVMNVMYGKEFANNFDVIVGTDSVTHDFITSRVKPWHFDEDRALPTENVLLWD